MQSDPTPTDRVLASFGLPAQPAAPTTEPAAPVSREDYTVPDHRLGALIAHAKGLPDDLAEMLHGSPEQMAAQADKLAERLVPPPGSLNGGIGRSFRPPLSAIDLARTLASFPAVAFPSPPSNPGAGT